MTTDSRRRTRRAFRIRSFAKRGPHRSPCCVVMALATLAGCDSIPADPGACGGPAETVCAAGEFCKFNAGVCNAAGATGVCTVVPVICTDIFQPVCGCDGTTYSNACLADAAGVSVATDGQCGQRTDPFCGGIVGVACEQGFFCRFETGGCGSGDQTGVCDEIPDACVEVVDPVCGCDGVTYSNECAAARAGVSLAGAGACR